MKESKYKIKIVCGFRKDQEFSIDANEAHKAYYLFNNPDKRGVFNSGLALKGVDIQRIEPDFNATMGWNQGYALTPADWDEVNRSGVSRKFTEIMGLAKDVARSGDAKLLAIPLIELSKDTKLRLE